MTNNTKPTISYSIVNQRWHYVLCASATCNTGVETDARLATNNQDEDKNPLVVLDEKGELTITQGYAWDGSSGPTVDTEKCMYASLVHDALYQLMRIEDKKKNKVMGNSMPRNVFRKKADKLYRKLCRENGMAWFQYRVRYYAIRWFGKSSVVARGLPNNGNAPAEQ